MIQNRSGPRSVICIKTSPFQHAAPPFVLSHSEADEMLDKAWKALDLTQKALQ
jgi:hypothetical protein